MVAVRDEASGSRASVRDPDNGGAGAALVAAYFDGEAPGGLFAQPAVDVVAQREMLSTIDKRLEDSSREAAEGPAADGSMSEAELRRALNTLPRGKAPGLDGLPYEFYSTFWTDVHPLLASAVNEQFLGTADDPRYDGEFTLGLITLIFKGTVARPMAADLVGSYRPITLLNTDLKLLAKAVTIRLGPALATVVDATQTAFVPGRWIGDNILAHLSIIFYFF
jgi:hypothetical protein